MTTLSGYAIVFNSLSENLGGFREEIAPAAVDRTLRHGTDLRALIDHDTGRLLGRISSGTLRVAKDASGLRFEVDLPDTRDGHDVGELVKRRDLTGASFAFMTLQDEWRDGGPGEVPTRRVLDMATRELSAVAWPAYPATSVSLRALAPMRGTTVSARLARAAVVGALDAVERRSMWEIAAVKNEAGQLIAHDEGRRGLAGFLAAKQAGQPTDAHGDPMVWRATRTPRGWSGHWVSRHLSLAAAASRQLEVERILYPRGRP